MTNSNSPGSPGRPKGRKSRYKMRNGQFTHTHLFLYVPEDSIPEDELNRYLELCDKMIEVLDPRTVTNPELEEISSYYRDQIVLDYMYRTLVANNCDATADLNLIRSIDSMSKQLEKRKENLQVRAKDRQKSRSLTRQKTVMDLLGEVDEGLIKEEAAKLKEINKEVEENYTSTENYMEEHLSSGFSITEED